LFVFEITKGVDCRAQKIVIEKFISHPLIKNMIPNYLNNLSIMTQHQNVISSLKTIITDHLMVRSPPKLWLLKILFTCSLQSQSGACKIQGVARALGINRHNIKKAMERCLQLDTEKNVFWIRKQQSKR
jgi:hypothetical protein